jgi:dihydropteroate synthase
VGDFVHSPDHATALLDYFRREIDRAVNAGVHAIWIDPGLGFYYKNLQDRVSEQLLKVSQTVIEIPVFASLDVERELRLSDLSLIGDTIRLQSGQV